MFSSVESSIEIAFEKFQEWGGYPPPHRQRPQDLSDVAKGSLLFLTVDGSRFRVQTQLAY